jgi:hypothetical protein
MLTTRHIIGQTAVTNIVIYGFPKGPTWPNALQLTEELLQIATTEIILGGTGPRLIGGDFNMDAWGIPLFNYWRQLGWISAQELAERLWGQEPQFTCKHATERDLVWLSPEAAALCQMVDVADVFAEHSTITVGLCIPTSNPRMLSWPKPSEIPWTEVDAQWTSTADGLLLSRIVFKGIFQILLAMGFRAIRRASFSKHSRYGGEPQHQCSNPADQAKSFFEMTSLAVKSAIGFANYDGCKAM